MTKKILWFNFKDINHPEAGGAELVTHEMCKKLITQGHEVTLVTARYSNSSELDDIDGVKIIRVGKSKLGHYPEAVKYYLKHLKNKFDILIEEVNTVPYFLNFFKGKETLYLYYNQLAREIWFYQMTQPISTIGFIVEPIYTWIQSLFNNKVMSISESSRADLTRFGFKASNIDLMTMFTFTKPLEKYNPKVKNSEFTVLFHSSLRPMKRPEELFKAFAIFVENHPNAKLWISGGGDQSKLKIIAKENNFEDKVVFYGRTTDEFKLELMQTATVLCSTSLKEGWGLILTETNSMGTPCIAYDIDGLRDASKTGGNWTIKPNPQALAQKLSEVNDIFLNNRTEYDQKCEEVLEKSRRCTVDQCYEDFKQIIGV